MKKNIIIKKIKHGLKLGLAVGIVSLSLTSCGLINKDYISQEKIKENAEFLNCDMSYFAKENGDFVRMKHNNGEPIYICFDDEYSPELKDKAKDSLDYVFGIVGKINSNYHYKIVDKSEFNAKNNKTKIYYTFGEHVSTYKEYTSIADAHLEQHSAWYNKYTDKPVRNYFELNLNKKIIKNLDAVDYSLIHELLHAFGFNDVYTTLINQTTTKFYGNTIMHTSGKFKIVTPNDLACLISVYANDDTDMEKVKYYYKKYETKFYNEYADWCKEQVETEEEFVEENFYFETCILIEKDDKTTVGYDYKFKIEDGEYVFEIYDYHSNELLDSCRGETLSQNATLILKNVELKHGMRPKGPYEYFDGGSVQDLIFLSKNGKPYLYDFHTNYNYFGFLNTLKKGLTQ